MCETGGPVVTCSSEWGVNLQAISSQQSFSRERWTKGFVVLLLKCLNIAVAVSQCFCKYPPLVAWELPANTFYLTLGSWLYSCLCSVSNRTGKFCSALKSFTGEMNRWNNADPNGGENPALPKVNKELVLPASSTCLCCGGQAGIGANAASEEAPWAHPGDWGTKRHVQ